MNTTQIIRKILKDNRTTIRTLGKTIGKEEKNLQQMITRADSASIKNLLPILEGMGCTLIIRDNARACYYEVDNNKEEPQP